MADLNRFFGLLFAGKIVSQSSPAQMRRAVTVISQEGKTIEYGLGVYPMEVCGGATFWGNGGTVWGAGAISMTSADAERQMSVAINLQMTVGARTYVSGSRGLDVSEQPPVIAGAVAVCGRLVKESVRYRPMRLPGREWRCR